MKQDVVKHAAPSPRLLLELSRDWRGFPVFCHNNIGERSLLPPLSIPFPMHRIWRSFPTLVIGAFQVLGLFENIDLRDKFLRGQYVVINAESHQGQSGFLFFLGVLIVHGGFHLLLNFGNRRGCVGSGCVFPVGFPDIL